MEAATLTRQQEDMTSRPAESKTSGYLKVLCCSLARPNPAEACLSEWIRPASDYVRLARPRKCDSGLIWSEIGSREDKKKGKGKIRGNANRRKYQERKLGLELLCLKFSSFQFWWVMFWHSFAAVTLLEMIGGLGWWLSDDFSIFDTSS